VPADLALVIGGYNSSNTSHLVELCEQKLPTYFINHEDCLISTEEIRHYSLHEHTEQLRQTHTCLRKDLSRVMVTSGASCPDALVERIITRLAELTCNTSSMEALLKKWE
jgi:4-hydroxy-3-methylbut-2-enyl diphosphate reductase